MKLGRSGKPEQTWRDEVSLFRMKVTDETARCLANEQSSATHGVSKSWTEMTSEEQNNLAEFLFHRYIAEVQAMGNLIKRGASPQEELIAETAQCLADHLSASTDGVRPNWAEMSVTERNDLTKNLTAISILERQAISNLTKRGEIV